MSYPLLAGLVITTTAVGVLILILTGARPPWRALALGMCGMLVLTAVFDTLIIAIGLVDYDPATLLGPRLGPVPIEDFSYAIAAALGAPVLFSRLRKDRTGTPGGRDEDLA